MQLARPPRSRREQAFEQLYIGRHHHWGRPILHRQPQLVAAGAVLVVLCLVLDGQVMLQHMLLAQKLAENRRRLVNDRGERNRINDPLVPVLPRVIQRKAQRGQSFAAARRHCQREQTGRHRSLAPRMRENVRPQLVDPLGIRFARKFCHIRRKRRRHLWQNFCKTGPVPILRTLVGRIKRLGIAVIGVDQSREQHSRGD